MQKKAFLPLILTISFSLAGCSGLPVESPPGPSAIQTDNITDNASREPFAPSSIKMITGTAGWALNGYHLIRTRDGGNQWEDITLPGKIANPRDIITEFLDDNTAWLATSAEKGSGVTVFRTGDGGRSWMSASVPAESTGSELILLSLNFIDSEHGWLMVQPEHGMNSSPGQLFATTDGGAAWSQIATTSGTENIDPGALPFGGEVVFRDSATGWVVGANASTAPNRLYITQDGGHTWQQQKLALPTGYLKGKINVETSPVLFPPDFKEGVLKAAFVPDSYKTVDYANIFYITRDGGLTWQSRKPIQPDGIRSAFINADNWWYWQTESRESGSTAPVKVKLCHTADAGRTWSEISPDKTLQELFQSGQDIRDLDFIDDKTGWMLISPQDTSSDILLKTTDGGKNWRHIYPK